MQFGIYAEIQTRPEQTHEDRLERELRAIEHADRVGFDVYSAIEHHCVPEFSISANPLMLFVAAAQRTRRLRFRTALNAVPLHNPVRLAADIALADILTGGRLEVGLGEGQAWLYPPFNVPMEESRSRFEEGVDVMLRAWTEPRVSFAGRHVTLDDVAVVPRPRQRPHPPLYTGGPSESSYRTAAERGWGLLLPPTRPLAAVRPFLDVYVQRCHALDRVPKVVAIKPLFLTDDPARVRSDVEPFITGFFAFNASPFGSLATTFEQILEQDLAWIGTPEEVAPRVAEVAAVPGVTEVAVMSSFGGLEQWKVLRTQELFAREVIPTVLEQAAVAT